MTGTSNNLLKTINKALSIVLFFLSVYLVVFPIAPAIAFMMSPSKEDKPTYDSPSTQEKIAKNEVEIKQVDLKPMPQGKVLSIPKIGVDGEVVLGDDSSLLNKGFWHRPNTSTPPNGGNTVITGHRYLYKSGPKTFYHLDKLELGDEFSIFWDGEEYRYKVFKINVVDPEGISIEKNTKENIVTLYTCTPLWSATQRLVVQAELI